MVGEPFCAYIPPPFMPRDVVLITPDSKALALLMVKPSITAVALVLEASTMDKNYPVLRPGFQYRL
jgi:hypothetical protein